MKAKKVYEDLSFKRGMTPKDSLGLGIQGVLPQIIEEFEKIFSESNCLEIKEKYDRSELWKPAKNLLYQLSFRYQRGLYIDDNNSKNGTISIYKDSPHIRCSIQIGGYSKVREDDVNDFIYEFLIRIRNDQYTLEKKFSRKVKNTEEILKNYES